MNNSSQTKNIFDDKFTEKQVQHIWNFTDTQFEEMKKLFKEVAKNWITFHMLNTCLIEPEMFVGKLQRFCSRDCAECPYEKLLDELK